jgi:hypothetical protein
MMKYVYILFELRQVIIRLTLYKARELILTKNYALLLPTGESACQLIDEKYIISGKFQTIQANQKLKTSHMKQPWKYSRTNNGMDNELSDVYFRKSPPLPRCRRLDGTRRWRALIPKHD